MSLKSWRLIQRGPTSASHGTRLSPHPPIPPHPPINQSQPNSHPGHINSKGFWEITIFFINLISWPGDLLVRVQPVEQSLTSPKIDLWDAQEAGLKDGLSKSLAMPAIKERDGGIISGQPVMERLIFSTGWLLKTIENYWKVLKSIEKKTLSSSQPWGAMWGSPELWGCWSILWVTCMWRWPGRLKWFGMRKAITSHCEQWEFMQQMNNTKICLYESKGVGWRLRGGDSEETILQEIPPLPFSLLLSVGGPRSFHLRDVVEMSKTKV